MDNLSATALAAKRAGMSYGKYMAMHHKIVEPKKEPEEMRVCPWCGEKFSMKGKRKDKIYCSDSCCTRAGVNRRYYAIKEAANKG